MVETAIAFLQMPCNILPVFPQQLGHKFNHSVKTSKVILVSLFQKLGRPWAVSEKKTFKDFTILYMFIVQGQLQITLQKFDGN